jgi:hypothetical protein
VLSARVGNYQFDPYLPVLIDQLWSIDLAKHHQVTIPRRGEHADPDISTRCPAASRPSAQLVELRWLPVSPGSVRPPV